MLVQHFPNLQACTLKKIDDTSSFAKTINQDINGLLLFLCYVIFIALFNYTGIRITLISVKYTKEKYLHGLHQRLC